MLLRMMVRMTTRPIPEVASAPTPRRRRRHLRPAILPPPTRTRTTFASAPTVRRDVTLAKMKFEAMKSEGTKFEAPRKPPIQDSPPTPYQLPLPRVPRRRRTYYRSIRRRHLRKRHLRQRHLRRPYLKPHPRYPRAPPPPPPPPPPNTLPVPRRLSVLRLRRIPRRTRRFLRRPWRRNFVTPACSIGGEPGNRGSSPTKSLGEILTRKIRSVPKRIFDGKDVRK